MSNMSRGRKPLSQQNLRNPKNRIKKKEGEKLMQKHEMKEKLLPMKKHKDIKKKLPKRKAGSIPRTYTA